jgi:hypothetical protein
MKRHRRNSWHRLGAVVSACLALGGRPTPAGAKPVLTVVPLTIPSGYVLAEDRSEPDIPVTSNDRGDVASVIRPVAGGAQSPYVWYADGSRLRLAPPPIASFISDPSRPQDFFGIAMQVGALGPKGELYALAQANGDAIGAVLVADGFFVYRRSQRTVLKTACGSALANFALDDGSIGQTFRADMSGETPDHVDDGSYAPSAKIARGSRCIDLGASYLTASRGEYVAGYRGFVDAKSTIPATSGIDQGDGYYVAVRWTDLSPTVLGKGAALGVNDVGTCVGVDGYPNAEGAEARTNHAMVWGADGKAKRLVTGDERSAAVGIDDDGHIVGTLVDLTTKKRLAFVTTKSGAVIRLDDLVRAVDWQLQYATAILPDGTVVGVGTYRGVAMPFLIHGVAAAI